MRAASSPALRAPPIETVATGMPAGICTIESSESSPPSWASGTGTPIIGSVVTEASIPGRCAAPPAPAMMTRMPRLAAADPKAIIRFGVRCAETTSTSCGIPNSASAAAASLMTPQSESEPITTATSGAEAVEVPGTRPMLWLRPGRIPPRHAPWPRCRRVPRRWR